MSIWDEEAADPMVGAVEVVTRIPMRGYFKEDLLLERAEEILEGRSWHWQRERRTSRAHL